MYSQSVSAAEPVGYPATSIGSAFSDRFTRFKLLGSGDDGAVFSVWDGVRKDDLALKLMRDTGVPGQLDRFERDYQILAVTRSDRLVRVFDHGLCTLSMADGAWGPHFWYSMEKHAPSVRASFQQMALAGRLRVVRHMLDGLAVLHARNIAHRDIKPDHLFLSPAPSGNVAVKIGDFGIATVGHVASSPVEGTPGAGHRSPAYLAPERWVGDHDPDWRSADQYAAGITLFEVMSNGHLPLDFTDGHLWGHDYSAVSPLIIPELGGRRAPAVDRVIGQMLAKRSHWRFPNMACCKFELDAALLQDRVE